MAPSSQYNRRQFGNGGGENINPQQNNYNAYASLTRLAKYTTTTNTTNNTTSNNNNNSNNKSSTQPSAAAKFQRGRKNSRETQERTRPTVKVNNKSNNNPMKKKTTGIERSYLSINNTRKSLGGAVNGGRSSAGNSGNNNVGGGSSSGGSISSSSSYPSFTRHATKKNTGIERSYDSVTHTLKSVGSFVSGTSSTSAANKGAANKGVVKRGANNNQGKKKKKGSVKNRESFRSNEGCGSYLPSNSRESSMANSRSESGASGMANSRAATNSRESLQSKSSSGSTSSSSSEESSSVDDIFRTTLQNNTMGNKCESGASGTSTASSSSVEGLYSPLPPEPVASSTFDQNEDDNSTVIQQSVTFDENVTKDKGRESIQEAHSRKMKDLFPSPYPTNTNGGVSKINNTRDVHNSEGGVSKSEGGGVSKFQHEINTSTMGTSFQEDEAPFSNSAVQDVGTTSGSNSTVASAVTSEVIGSHLRQIAPSKDEYDKLKRESYELKKKHEVRHGGAAGVNKKGYGKDGEVGIKKEKQSKLSKVISGRQLEDGMLIGKSSRPTINHTRGISEAPSNVSGFTNNGLPHLLASHHSRMSSATELDDHQLLYENSELDRAYNERVAKRSIGVGVTPGVKTGGRQQQEKQERRSMATQTSGKKENKEMFTHSTSTALITNKAMKKSNNRSSNGLYSARLGADRNSLDRVNKVGKGMVKMTTESLSKIRDVLHLTNSNDDEMSFFVSDAKTGEITKQKVSLDKEKTDDDDDEPADDDDKNTETTTGRELMIISASDKAARGSRLATEKRAPPQSVKKVATLARDSMDHAASQIKNGIGPALEAATRTAIAATKEGVDVMAHDVAPKIGVGIANTAKLTAKGVVKVTQQSVEGMGMIVHDLANAKTPGKSNVTTTTQKMEDGRYADYVHDPNYKVVLTPPNDNNNTKNAGKTPFAYCDPLTPGCLVGAVTAGRCNLPGTHPDSLEFLPDGIPRELVVYDDWEERAGFLPTTAAVFPKYSERVADSPKFAVEAKANVAPEDRRISHPVDIDEETTTINGDEVDVDEYVALKQGRPSPKNANNINGQGFEADEEGEEEENDENEEEDPRNASMWVAVPDHYMEDDDNASADNYLEKSAEEINMGDLLNDSVENEAETKEEEQPLPTPESFGSGAFFVGNVQVDEDASVEKEQAAHNTTTPESCGNDTFFVGDVQIGSESSPESTMNAKRINEEEEVVVEDVTSEEDDAAGTVVEEDTVVSPDDDASKALVDDAKSWTAPSNMEDLNVYQNRGSPPTLTQVASSTTSVGKEEDSLASLAKATTAAVVNNKQQQQQQEKAKEFETPHSVRKGERPLSYTEFKNMSKSVLFDLDQTDKSTAAAVSDNDGGGENYAHQLYLNPSESTELSHEPPIRMIDSSAQQLYTNPSESTDLSQFSNWAAPAVPTATNQVKTVDRQNTQRQLKGRIILVRIKKKLSKVAKKMLFIKPKEKKDEIIKDGNGFVIELPNNTNAAAYPDHSSPLSISSSIMSGVPAKHTLGANPPKHGAPTPAQQYLYGTINYGNRSPDDSSTVDGSSDSLPPPPALLPSRPNTSNSEDVVSYLAEAMKRSHSHDNENDDEEDSVLLLLTPRGDGSGEEICEVISALDGTPNLREAIDVGNEDDQIANSEVKPNNLSSLFTDQKGNNNIHHFNGKPIEIMDAVEVDEGIVLTPHKVNHNVSDVFRTSIDACSILPGSHIDSEGEDEDATLLYHDGNTLIRQSSTFGDNTIATMTSALPPTKEEEEVEKIEPKLTVKATKNEDTLGTPILSPDGLPLTHQAAANASFLFSPQNMGRADPKIRAKERLKGAKTKPSITMLPTATAKGGESALVIRQSYSSRSSSLGTNTNLQIMSKESVVASTNKKMESNDEEEIVQNNKQPMTSMKEDRQFSFKTILNKFSTDADDGHHVSFTATAPPEEPPALPSKEEERTPVTTNSHHPKKKYPKSPFPADGAVIKSVASEDSSSPLLVSLNVGLNSSPLSAASVSSFKSNKGKKKKASPKSKKVPKSALKVRKGFVKDRVSDFHQRTSIATATSNGGVPTPGRLKRNHSYKTKNTRRMTNGNGVLAPRHAVLQTTYIRSVPIAIAKTYSKDSIGNSFSFAHDEAKNNEEARVQQGTQEEEENRVSFASKQQVESPSSPDSVKSSSSSDDASETTEHDPFNSLLGKVLNDDDSSDEDEVYESDIVDKENAANSPSVNLGFKSTTRTLVKPTEINQHGDQGGALSPVPMKARSWRVLAAAAKLDKQNKK